MARLALVAADPGGVFIRGLGDAAEGAGHEVRTITATAAEAAEAASLDLVVYVISNDPDAVPAYSLAVTLSGLVVLPNPGIDRLLDALTDVDRASAEAAVHEAAAALAALGAPGADIDAALSLRLARRARALVVGSGSARGSLEALGCSTPTFVAPGLGDGGDPAEPSIGAIVRAIEVTLARSVGPIRRALERWASALAWFGVAPEGVERGSGARYADAIEGMEAMPAREPGPRPTR